jgi:hypothetical protein
MNPMPMTMAVMRSSTNPFVPGSQLDRALEARLLAHPRVRDFHRSTRDELILSSSAVPSGTVTRRVRLTDRILTIVAIPNGSVLHHSLRRSLQNRWNRSDILVISERWLARRPQSEVSEIIAASAGYPVPPLSRILIAEHLTDCGGSAYLQDCTALMIGVDDPVQAVLALAAAKNVTIDISRPIGSLTKVSLPSSR